MKDPQRAVRKGEGRRSGPSRHVRGHGYDALTKQSPGLLRSARGGFGTEVLRATGTKHEPQKRAASSRNTSWQRDLRAEVHDGIVSPPLFGIRAMRRRFFGWKARKSGAADPRVKHRRYVESAARCLGMADPARIAYRPHPRGQQHQFSTPSTTHHHPTNSDIVDGAKA